MPSSKITYAFYSAGGHARETRRGFLDGLAAGSGSDAEVVFIDDDPALYQLRIHGSYVISYEEALAQTARCCTPLNLWTVSRTLQPIRSTENLALIKIPLLKGQPGALDRDSGERPSAIFWCDGF